jgi:hypothetical protein
MSDEDDDRENEEDSGSESEEDEEGKLPKVLKPFVQGGEEMLLTAKRVSNYSEGEACYGIVVGIKVGDIGMCCITNHAAWRIHGQRTELRNREQTDVL